MSTARPSGDEFFEEDESVERIAQKFARAQKGVTRKLGGECCPTLPCEHYKYSEEAMRVVIGHLGRVVRELDEARLVARGLYQTLERVNQNFGLPSLPITHDWLNNDT
jgi:RNA:NAD 2'-phosphotransferase (TPT1/KptA family)